MATMTIRISLAWWVTPYLRTLAFLCWMLGTEPDMERVGYWVGKGIKIK